MPERILILGPVGDLGPVLEAPYHEAFVSGHQIYQSLALACPSVRARLVKIPSGGNDGVKKLDRGLDGKGKRRQLIDGRVFGGNQVCGQRNGTFVDGAEERGASGQAGARVLFRFAIHHIM